MLSQVYQPHLPHQSPVPSRRTRLAPVHDSSLSRWPRPLTSVAPSALDICLYLFCQSPYLSPSDPRCNALIMDSPPSAPQSGPVFSLAHGDFVVQSLDGVEFSVSRAKLESGSDVFRDMFAMCDVAQEQRLVLPEPSPALSVLLRLLQDPPSRDPAASAAIPLPLLPALFTLADKYALADTLSDALQAHLAAHASALPIRVYALACELGLAKVASDASAYTLSTPLHELDPDEVARIPTARAYHALVVLHAHRVSRLRTLLLAEELFPKDYGLCTAHGAATRDLWERKAHFVWGQMAAGLDVAEEMGAILTADPIRGCELCRMGCVRAVEMLRVSSINSVLCRPGARIPCLADDTREVQVLEGCENNREAAEGDG
ncbi:hypothetical protein EXIGLDRAFT_511707 [Exidia glandulosa HHB12029]|uniref:BTB domain-containing protein n=1 Tax=Exidia glandulosa HHB12029 TaxID=1314781 RepID=A0A165PEI0_EXIGL|nr:hypothetical protein EXIGLDRAFT_511707 [Exidia glandulosa HHB12029]